MRIGFFCCTFGKSGGMETYALNLIQAALELGHKPVVFCMKSDPNLGIRNACEVHEYRKPPLIPNKIAVYLFHRWLIKEVPKHKLDVSIGCCTGGLPDVLACGGIKEGYLHAMKKKPLLLDKLIINIEKEAYSQAKVVVAHSMMMDRELQRYYGISSEKIHVLYPPQLLPVVNNDLNRHALREKYGIRQDQTVFLFPSSSHKRKGLPLLEEYFNNTKNDCLLLVVGKPTDDSRNVKSIGFCKQIQELYQLADYTILASLYEPLGLVATESVWCGTPAIMSSNCGCAEVISSEAIRSFSPYSIKDLTALLDDVIQHPIKLSAPFRKYLKLDINLPPTEHLKKVLALAQA